MTIYLSPVLRILIEKLNFPVKIWRIKPAYNYNTEDCSNLVLNNKLTMVYKHSQTVSSVTVIPSHWTSLVLSSSHLNMSQFMLLNNLKCSYQVLHTIFLYTMYVKSIVRLHYIHNVISFHQLQ